MIYDKTYQVLADGNYGLQCQRAALSVHTHATTIFSELRMEKPQSTGI